MIKLLQVLGTIVLVGMLAFALVLGGLYVTLLAIHSRARTVTAQTLTPVDNTPHEAALAKSDSLVIDPGGYGTEDNWIAATVAREIAQMAFLGIHPGQSVPDLTAKAQVDPAKPLVSIQLEGFAAQPLNIELKPAFAWDPEGYAPLAQRLLGDIPSAPAPPPETDSGILARLLLLTGYRIAQEDLQVSKKLLDQPTSWQEHETAALTLMALALRENAGPFTDSRLFLNRATAHLAVARALRGNQPATWPGAIADAAIRTFAGRELDAVAHLDALAARPDCPEAARAWIEALRLVAVQDWRAAQVTAQSPLLLKIAWFQVLVNNLGSTIAVPRLDAIQPPGDSENREMSLPDWGRAVVGPDYAISVENNGRFGRYNIPLELKELADILHLEGGESVDPEHLTACLSGDEGSTISRDAQGKPVVQVIGPNAFKAAARRHLFNDIRPGYTGIEQGLGLANDAGTFLSETNVRFRGVPQYELAQANAMPIDDQATLALAQQVQARQEQWKVWDVSPAAIGQFPGHDIVQSFYAAAVPFGTVYQPEQRIYAIHELGMKAFYEDGGVDQNALFRELYKTPASPERTERIQTLTDDANKHPETYAPQAPTAFDRALLHLAPHCYVLSVHFVLPDNMLPYAKPYLDYNIRPAWEIADKAFRLSDADLEFLLSKEIVFDPGVNFDLAVLRRKQGKPDEAAALDRKGFKEGFDAVRNANSVGMLVDYDYTHGLKDEALAIAQSAAGTGSNGGVSTYVKLLGRLGRYDEALEEAQGIVSRYHDETTLQNLYAAHPDHFPGEFKRTADNIFPDGMRSVTVASFANRPTSGVRLNPLNKFLFTDQLLPGDIIVGLDGYKVDNLRQYIFVRAMSDDPKMRFIVWRAGAYLEVNVSLPNRSFNGAIDDYRGEPL